MPLPSGPISREFSGRDDLRAIGALMSATWTGPRRPLVPGTVGDVEWWTVGGGPDADWPGRIRIWERDGRPVAWGWFNPPGGLDWFVGDGLSPDEEAAVRGAIVDWLEERARNHRATTRDATGPITLETWAGEGWTEEAFLHDRGWTRTETALSQYMQALDLDLDAPRVPDGYVLRHVRGPAEFPARVEAHRAAFAPSKITLEKYALLPGLDHYRFEHDLVLEAPDGSIAAFAICWVDPVGSIGEFEPVGVHPDHQRRGLGRVIMRTGLRLMREAGLRDALVFSDASNAASEALYRSAGFDRVAVHRRYELAIEP
jgi:ribosomal protein S18 acetylase RimI-like enzyme